MYHSINFGDVNTYDDWLIVPSSRPVINPPKQKTQILDIPGANGSLDISEVLTGYPVFENRTGDIEFIVLNDYVGYDWNVVYTKIMNYLHGKCMKCVLEDDPGYYYDGRFTVNQWKSEKDWSRITISYDVNPYKWSLLPSTSNWEWDPFNFYTGVIMDGQFRNIPVPAEGVTRTFPAILFGDAPISPDFIVNANSGNGMDYAITIDGITMRGHLPQGTSKIYGLTIYKQNVTMQFTGEGTISIKFVRGSL